MADRGSKAWILRAAIIGCGLESGNLILVPVKSTGRRERPSGGHQVAILTEEPTWRASKGHVLELLLADSEGPW
jgi:hypothetical protein